MLWQKSFLLLSCVTCSLEDSLDDKILEFPGHLVDLCRQADWILPWLH